MKAKKMSVAVLATMLVLGSLAITNIINLISRYQPFYQPMNENSYSIYDFILQLVTIALQVALLSFAYIRFRKVLPNEKAQWLVIIISTIALTVAPIASLFILEITTISGMPKATLMHYLHPATLFGNFIMSFLLSLGIVFLITRFYKRQSGFEVE